MKVPPHLEGIVGALTAIEKACEGTDYDWHLSKAESGYFAGIVTRTGRNVFTHHALTPAGALFHVLMEFNLRTKGHRS